MNVYSLLLALTILSCGSSSEPDIKGSHDSSFTNENTTDSLNSIEQRDSIIKFLIGKFDPASIQDFVEIPIEFASKKGMFIQKEVLEAFTNMHNVAKSSGITLTIVSGTRNFEQQKAIWNRKFEERVFRMSMIPSGQDSIRFAKDILLYSSMPGTSRHHWGTDIDLNSLEPEFFSTPEGEKIYSWLYENASRFGFCQPYVSKASGRTGYEEEKWHWTYTPLSKKYLESYNQLVGYDRICCFKGSELATLLRVIQEYVNGINPACAP